ncbi:MAG: hypothetical protein Q4B43_07605 [Bacteroidota bacterium]|nr:hypothetical protein [Bacteroidota bacterium]
MRLKKLPFKIDMQRKYSDINIGRFIYDWQEVQENKRERVISMDNELHVELKKFESFNIDMNEIIDIGMRYALQKQEFRKMIVKLIHYKENPDLI